MKISATNMSNLEFDIMKISEHFDNFSTSQGVRDFDVMQTYIQSALRRTNKIKEEMMK